MDLIECVNCGHGGWSVYELKNGLCPSCQDDEPEFECCGACDQPDACADFGCAIKQGLKEPNTW